ncbi:hypothetical protein BJP25_18260 [Actinokineospora bangkokensis]|uniref:HAF repeat-containing protein n=1 Tax=Actinokineospora bangkokensis TaxID=1193682 RepID=A0A1Q9LLP0_9PSEU|nr:hypothetical protein BJP25_18260 [Actinokineospora bangkokensis]
MVAVVAGVALVGAAAPVAAAPGGGHGGVRELPLPNGKTWVSGLHSTGSGIVYGDVSGAGGTYGVVWERGRARVIEASAADSRIESVSEDGVVAGSYSTHGDGVPRAAVWVGERRVDLGLRGSRPSVARVDRDGDVLVTSYTEEAYGVVSVWHKGREHVLANGTAYLAGDPVFGPAGHTLIGTMAADGGVTYRIWDARGRLVAELPQDERFGYLRPHSINSRGQAVFDTFSPGSARAVVALWDGRAWVEVVGFPGSGGDTHLGGYEGTRAINDDGEVGAVAGLGPSGPNHVIRWRAGVVTDLSPDVAAGGYAVIAGINDRGDVGFRACTDTTWLSCRSRVVDRKGRTTVLRGLTEPHLAGIDDLVPNRSAAVGRTFADDAPDRVFTEQGLGPIGSGRS